MKLLCLTAALLISAVSLRAQQANPAYDKKLADSLGADPYGMKYYVLVILKTGPRPADNKDTVAALFKGHMENIGRLVKDGKLSVAGPMGKNDRNWRGIFILNVPTVEEAQALLQTDPSISSGLLEAECFRWYGSAALPLYLPYHDKLQEKKM
ncbi:YciI family protein [Chitinophaga sp.]|mgnify:CR=1 FL=1|uniref:YciI family protein n=1 Tax=Chitinophaga sp. TaxID=1869181 RepID=UPI00260F12B8|nr:YciI family protein [uncultured Chitinophaga sp.]